DTARVITLSGSDAETCELTFTIVSGPLHGSLSSITPAACVAGSPNSDTATVTYTPAADYNGPDSFTFKVNDGQCDSASATVSINVTAVNDAPSFTKGADQSVNEDTGAQTVASWATSISKGGGADEASQTVSFVFTANDNPGLFAAGPAIDVSGQLTYTPAANANGVANLSVKITDNGGTANGGVDESAAQSFKITVTSVNDAPAGSNNTVTTLEDNNYTFLVADFGFTDPNDSPANALAAVEITTLPGAGALKNNGVAVTIGQFVSAADIGAGKLKFSPAANANGAG